MKMVAAKKENNFEVELNRIKAEIKVFLGKLDGRALENVIEELTELLQAFPDADSDDIDDDFDDLSEENDLREDDEDD